jgi:S-formylglutathione hydrolase FrmB
MSSNDLTTIESSGSMSLLAQGSNYLLQPNNEPAVELSYGGAPVTDGEFGGWTPIAAAQTASGYELAWKMAGSDQYTIWYTDSSGNYLSSAFAAASGSSAQLESFEASFNYDLNGDGVIGVPSPAPIQFAYEGTDASGARVYDVVWNTPGLEPIAVRVLTPQHPSTDYSHSFLYDLPVQSGLAQSTYGSGLDELENLDVEDQYNATIIEPIFPMDSWYADNPNDPTINYETFLADILPQWVDSNFSTTGTEQNLLVGFSKSGYGALDLEFRHPSAFSAVAAFDFPGDMSSYDEFGSSSADDFGTQANFQDNYQMNASFIDAHDASFTSQDRILISEGPAFQSQVADFDTLLTSQGVMHTTLNQTSDGHSWSGGWLPGAIAGLFGLEQTLNSSAGS